MRSQGQQRARLIWQNAGGLDDEAAARIVEASQSALDGARIVAAASGDAYISTALELPPAGLGPGADLLASDELAYGSIVSARAAATTSGYDAAMTAGADALASVLFSDVSHAAASAVTERLSADDAQPLVKGYRRVPKGTTCGFCVAAASRIYHYIEKPVLHNKCNCDVREVAAGDDGHALVAPYLGAYDQIRSGIRTTAPGPLSHEYVRI